MLPLPRTITTHMFTSLNHLEGWWLQITLDPSLSHIFVVGFESWGGTIVARQWFCVAKFKKGGC